MRYRKKPVVIDAMQFSRDNWEEIESWSGRCVAAVGNRSGPDGEWHPIAATVTTLEGPLTAQLGDWIIRGVKGEFLPVQARHLRSHLRARRMTQPPPAPREEEE